MKMEQGGDLNREKVGEAGEGTSQGRQKTPRRPSSLNIRRRILLWRRQDPVMAEPQWGWSLSDAVILAAAVMLVVATTVFAQEYNPPIRTLVKNFDQSSDRGLLLNANQDGLNQGFRTGPNIGGYELTGIVLHVNDTHESRYMTLDAGIYLHDGSGFTRVAALTRGRLKDYAANEWSAPENTYLERTPSTTSFSIARQVAQMTTWPNSLRPTAVNTTPGPKKDGKSTIIAAIGPRAIPIGNGDPALFSRWRSRDVPVTTAPTGRRSYRLRPTETPTCVGENIDIALTFNTPVYVQDGKFVHRHSGRGCRRLGSLPVRLLLHSVDLPLSGANGRCRRKRHQR